MNYEVLRKVNRYIRNNRPTFDLLQPCEIFRTDRLLEIGFLSKRCVNDAKGTCVMCDYGAAKGTQLDNTYLQEMDDILKNFGSGIETLLLCSNGSILNPYQINDELFRKILIRAASTDIPQIEIECHYMDVTKKKLNTLKELLPEKQIIIELGLETLNPVYQECLIGKGIKIPEFEEKIFQIQGYGFNVDLNLMLGLPFLSPKEQYDDAKKTIMWILEHNCHAVLFPVNIKPFTLLMHMYQSGYYTPISHWMMVSLLDSIPEERLNEITVAWYGNREEIYKGTKMRAIFPVSCEDCGTKIEQFYKDFLRENDSDARKERIRQLIDSSKCDCLHKTQESLRDCSLVGNFESKYNDYVSLLKKEFKFLFSEDE